MKKMNKVLAFLVALGVLAAPLAFGPVAASAQGSISEMPLPLQRGRYFKKSTTVEEMVYTGRALVLALIRSTGPATSETYIRDTIAAHGGDQRSLPKIGFKIDTGVYQNPIEFPILHADGISLQLNSVAAGEEVTLVYMPLY